MSYMNSAARGIGAHSRALQLRPGASSALLAGGRGSCWLRARAAVAPWQNVRAASSTTPTTITPVEIIAKKREGDELTAAEVHTFIQQFTAGEVADYQMAAWLMAVCLRGMTPSETAELTLAMVQSGSVADLSDIPGAKSGMRHAPEYLY